MGKRILIVEDEVFAAEALKSLMKSMGFDEVETVTSGEKALEISKDFKPDTVLMDIKLPGMDGVETVKKLKENNNEISVVYITAYCNEDTKARASETKPNGFLCKPVVKEKLKSIIAHGKAE